MDQASGDRPSDTPRPVPAVGPVPRFDLRDYFVGGLVALMWVFASVFLWKYHSETNFQTWAAVCGTLTAVYHWLNIKDSA